MVIKMWCSHGEYYWQPECGSIKECVEWCIPYHHMPAYKGKCSSIFACIASLCLKASSSRRSDGQRISVDRFLSNSEARFLSGSLYCSWYRCGWWPLKLILVVSSCCPLYKNKGDWSACNNYPGISLLSIVGKVFACVTLSHLQSLAQWVYPESQCGFRALVLWYCLNTLYAFSACWQ